MAQLHDLKARAKPLGRGLAGLEILIFQCFPSMTAVSLSHYRCHTIAVSLSVSLIVIHSCICHALIANPVCLSTYTWDVGNPPHPLQPLDDIRSTAISTLEEFVQLVKRVSTLSNSLLPSIPKGTLKDKIWIVWQTQEGNMPFEIFNKRFDALFSEDCRDAEGCLPHIRQEKSGMGLVSTYLKKVDWSQDFLLDLVAVKLRQLVAELTHLM